MRESQRFRDKYCIRHSFNRHRNLTGNIDKRVLEKFAKEAKELNRESWFYSWAMDTNQDERAKVNIMLLIHWFILGYHCRMWNSNFCDAK